MRLPYAPSKPPSGSPEATQSAYAQLSARRTPAPLQALDLTLLHSPPLAAGWSSFLGAIRTETSLRAHIRELCICRVAALNRADYEWAHHVPLLKDAGVGEEVVECVKYRKHWAGWEAERCSVEGEGESTSLPAGLTAEQAAVLAYTDAMTVGIRVLETHMSELRTHFDDRGVVEITGTIAAYNCVSRFLVALDVGERNDTK